MLLKKPFNIKKEEVYILIPFMSKR